MLIFFFIDTFSYSENISDWDVSQVTDFSFLFSSKATFNDDIGDWDVAQGTNFVSTERSFGFQFKTIQYACDLIEAHLTNNCLRLSLCQNGMFAGAAAFNQDISSWDVSSGTAFVSTERSFGFEFKTIHYACET
jgi:hypothetical protein